VRVALTASGRTMYDAIHTAMDRRKRAV